MIYSRLKRRLYRLSNTKALEDRLSLWWENQNKTDKNVRLFSRRRKKVISMKFIGGRVRKECQTLEKKIDNWNAIFSGLGSMRSVIYISGIIPQFRQEGMSGIESVNLLSLILITHWLNSNPNPIQILAKPILTNKQPISASKLAPTSTSMVTSLIIFDTQNIFFYFFARHNLCTPFNKNSYSRCHDNIAIFPIQMINESSHLSILLVTTHMG